jgi:hypothetical protein
MNSNTSHAALWDIRKQLLIQKETTCITCKEMFKTPNHFYIHLHDINMSKQKEIKKQQQIERIIQMRMKWLRIDHKRERMKKVKAHRLFAEWKKQTFPTKEIKKFNRITRYKREMIRRIRASKKDITDK